jgi:hypothetical protein
MPSAWNNFVKKIYHEGKAKKGGYTFSEALKEASSRKSEMAGGNTEMSSVPLPMVPEAPLAAKVGGKRKGKTAKKSKGKGKTAKKQKK